MKISTYIINLKKRTDRKEHILKQFENREEFDVNIIEACENQNGKTGLWKSLCKIINIAKEKDLEYVLVCEDDHFFTSVYDKDKLQKHIEIAKELGCDILNGGISGYGKAIKVTDDLFQVNWFYGTQFIIVYKSIYDKILKYYFRLKDTEDGVLSKLASKCFVIYPFISEQTITKYSDVTPGNVTNLMQVSKFFQESSTRLSKI